KAANIINNDTSEDSRLNNTININYADMLYLQKEYDKAIKNLNETKAFTPEGNYYNLWKINYKLAKNYEAKHNNDKYNEHLEKAYEALLKLKEQNLYPSIMAILNNNENTKQVIDDTEMLLNFIDEYNLYIATNNKNDSANKDLVLRSILNNKNQKDYFEIQIEYFSSLNSLLKEDTKKLLQEWKQLQKELCLLQNSSNNKDYDKTIGELYFKFDKIKEKIKEDNRLKDVLQIDPDHLFALQRNLPDKTLLIYPIKKDNNILFILIANKIETSDFIPVDLSNYDKDLNEIICDIHNLILETNSNKSNSTINRKDQINQKSKELYNIIFEPIDNYIASNKLDVDTILFIPFGNMNTIPLALLLDNNDNYLFEKFAIVNVYNSSLLNVASNKSFPKHPKLTILTNNKVKDIQAENEANIIMKILPNTLHINNLSDLPEHTDIIHIATHAKYDKNNPNNSVIEIPYYDEKEIKLDSIAKIKHKINNSFVILSACETALSNENDGKELKSLALKFEYCGARGIIASLWPVDDSSTTELMEGFYKKLKKQLKTDKINVASALQKAQEEFVSKYKKGYKSLPASWAPFIIIGEWSYPVSKK
ncbi:MAG: CHAT domain-containing protein, partial [Cyanobacteriota bacterium]